MNPVATAQTLVSGASLAAASTFIVEYPCDPTNVPVGILWTWSANKNHSVTFGRARASCAAITSIERVTTPVPLTAPDNTAWGYDERIQPSGGFTYLHFVITNNDGANAMSYTVKATPLYDSTAASPGSQAGASGDVVLGEVQVMGSSDGGTTWYPVKVSAAGVQTHAIDQTTPGTTNAVALKGSTDGGTTWVPVKTDASGDQFTSIMNVSADKLQYNGVPSEDVTCTVAGQDYATVGAVPAGTKYVKVYCPNASIVAMGQVTAMACAAPLFDPAIFDPAIFQNAATGAVGEWVGAGQPMDLPVSATDVTNALHPHVQCPTAGSVVRFTFKTD